MGRFVQYPALGGDDSEVFFERKTSPVEKLFINFSNHPSDRWTDEQKSAVDGKIVDLKFPSIDPNWASGDIQAEISPWMEVIYRLQDEHSATEAETTVMVQGEMTFTFALVSALKSSGIRAVAACSDRRTAENRNGTKTVSFRFVQFREYA